MDSDFTTNLAGSTDLDTFGEFDQTRTPARKAVVELVQLWDKTVHTITLYPETSPLPDQFREKFYRALEALLHEQGEIALVTTDAELLYDGDAVYTASPGEDNNLAFVLFRDGIREIRFKAGLSRLESDQLLAAFAEALSLESEKSSLANRFWELGLDNFLFRVVDQFFDEDPAPPASNAALAEKSRIFFSGTSYNLLDFGEDEITGATPTEPVGDGEADDEFRLDNLLDEPSATDVDTVQANRYRGLQGERFEQITASLGRIDAVTGDEKRQIDELVARDTLAGDCRIGLEILFEIAARPDDGGSVVRFADEMGAMMEKQVDYLVSRGEWSGAIHALSGVRREQSRQEKTAYGRRLQQVLLWAGDKSRLWRLTEYLNANTAADLDLVRSYFELLGISAIPQILEMLGTLEHRPARKMVCDFLADAGKEAVDLVGAGVYDSRWYLVRNVAMVLGRVGTERAVSFLRKSVSHEDQRVRAETVRALDRIEGETAERELLRLLDDPVDDVRRRAMRSLARRQSRVAIQDLEQRIDDPRLKDRPAQETHELLAAYARIGQHEALQRLQALLDHRSLFGKAKWQAVQVAAVQAIATIDHPTARQTLKELGYRKSKSIREAAQKARRRQARQAREKRAKDHDDE